MSGLDITGHVYGDLTVVERAGATKAKQYKWKCVCRCGNETVASSNNLRTGTTKSCGCRKSIPRSRVNLTGMVFGFLTAVKYSRTAAGHARWLCRCECGNTTEARAISLTKGLTRSCGCQSQFLAKNNPTQHHHGWANRVKKAQGECLKCGSRSSLHAHHIAAKCVNKNLAKDFSNGATLCATCHKDLHSIYGSKTTTHDLCEWLGLSELATNAMECFVGHRVNGGRERLEKAIHFLNMLLELEYSDG